MSRIVRSHCFAATAAAYLQVRAATTRSATAAARGGVVKPEAVTLADCKRRPRRSFACGPHAWKRILAPLARNPKCLLRGSHQTGKTSLIGCGQHLTKVKGSCLFGKKLTAVQRSPP